MLYKWVLHEKNIPSTDRLLIVDKNVFIDPKHKTWTY